MLNNKLYSFTELLQQGIFSPIEDSEVNTESSISIQGSFQHLNAIVVPMIQRPYAQGRKTEYETKVRENFLDDIFKILVKENEILELNFVYGVHTKSDHLNLLDGQQRLTTLFLLYWYFLMKNEGEITEDILNSLRKFTYQTRTTSSQFIEKLLKKKIKILDLPSRIIRKSPWYTSAYSKDTTVTGMLTMLDSIHNKAVKLEREHQFTLKDLERLKFYLLELKNFGREDDLFIKMNARGLQLTPFENFKAELVGWMKNKEKNETFYEKEIKEGNNYLPLWLSFSSNMDGGWTDLFWEMPTNDEGNLDLQTENLGADISDTRFFTFIKRWLANRSLTITSSSSANSDLESFNYFNSKAGDNFYHSFDPYENLLIKAREKGIDLIQELKKTLDFLVDNKTGEKILEKMCPPWIEPTTENLKEYLPWMPKFEMRPMIIFSAVVDFILTQDDEPENFNEDEFNRWMRLVHNIVQNRDISGVNIQITLTRQLQRILSFKKIIEQPDTDKQEKITLPIYERFIAYTDDLENTNRNLLSRELLAEKGKLKLILEKDKAWEDAFIEAEANPFMTGAVSFYLGQEPELELYKYRTNKIPLIFDEKGIVEDLRTDYKLIRAILSRSFNFSDFKLPGYRFQLCNQNIANRFLKNMTVWTDNEDVKSFFCVLLDCSDKLKMTEYINNVTQENNQIIPKSNWDESITNMIQMGFNKLIDMKATKALKWLESTKEQSMGVYVYDNGEMAIYKGSVNCMFLNSYREEYLPILTARLNDIGFEVNPSGDIRPENNYKLYNLYTGTRIQLQAKNENLVLIILLDYDMKAYLYFNSKDLAIEARKNNSYMVKEQTSSLMFLNPEDEEIGTYVSDGKIYYLGLQVNDIRQFSSIEEIIEILNSMEYNIIQD